MKKTTAWLLLATYLSASCAGVLPLAGDIVAHLFWHDAHIKHVHQGQKYRAHVAAETAQILDPGQSHPEAFAESAGGQISLSVHDLSTTVLMLPLWTRGATLLFPDSHFNLPSGDKPSVFMPPKPA